MREASLFIDSKEVAVAFGEDHDMCKTFREDDYSVTEVRFKRIVPMAGMTLGLRDILMNRTNVVIEMRFTEEGRLWRNEMRLVTANWREDWADTPEARWLEGEFLLIGGEPTLEPLAGPAVRDGFDALGDALLEGLTRGLGVT
jgi:hypothetical protein